ncbi:MAG: fasciclin domain-containing protein [Actinomycetota bacterium]|nr:fasciclin domain-containing protein [Actinomycetota bacterium]
MQNITRRPAMFGAALAMSLTLAACGGGGGGGETEENTDAAAEATTSAPASASGAAEQFGEACGTLPQQGEGSLQGMADDPVATAASNNPALKTLVAAVTQANLGDTLNSAQDITVFAPTNEAFAALPKATMNAAMANKQLLTTVLTGHVVQGRLSPEDVAGTHKTLQGGSITVEGSGEEFTVGGAGNTNPANVVCGNVQTANATVYIIDSVLLPKM